MTVGLLITVPESELPAYRARAFEHANEIVSDLVDILRSDGRALLELQLKSADGLLAASDRVGMGVSPDMAAFVRGCFILAPVDPDRGVDVEALALLVGNEVLRFVDAVRERPMSATGRDKMEPRAEVPVARVSYRLSGWAVRMLPADSRVEYDELFRSELVDLVLQ